MQKNLFRLPLFPILFFLLVAVITLPRYELFASEKESASALRRLKESVQYHTLSNGLRVILHKRGVAPVFSGVLSVRVGGADEQVGHTGASHLLEHMAFKGTKTLGTKNYSREKGLLKKLDRLLDDGRKKPQELSEQDQEKLKEVYEQLSEIWNPDAFARTYREHGGVGLNATTAKEITNYFISLPNSAFDFWCWMESERLRNPVLRQYYKERDVVMEERRLRYEDDPGGKLYEQLLSNVFHLHPYRNPVIGYKQDIDRLPITWIKDFLDTYYVPSNMVLSVVGDIDPETALKSVKRYFGSLPKGSHPPHTTLREPKQLGERRFTIRHPSSSQMAIAYRKAQYPDPDDPPLSVLFEMLGGSRISPLYTELVEKRKVATSFSYFEAPGFAYPNLIVFYGQPRAPHTNKTLLRNFDQVLARFVKKKVNKEKFAIAKRSIAMQFLTGLRSNISLAKDMAESELIYGDWAASIDWYEAMVAVTPEDIQRVGQKYFVRDQRVIGMLETDKGSQGGKGNVS